MVSTHAFHEKKGSDGNGGEEKVTPRIERTGLAALVVALVSCQQMENVVEEDPTPSLEYPLCDIGELEAYEQEINLYASPSCELTDNPGAWAETLGQNVDPAKIDCGLCVKSGSSQIELKNYCCYDKEQTTDDDWLQQETGCFRSEVRHSGNLPSDLLNECLTLYPPHEDFVMCNYHTEDCDTLKELLSNPSQTCEYTEDITTESFHHYYLNETELFCLSHDRDEIEIGSFRRRPGYCCSEKEIQTEQEGIEVFVDVLSSNGLAFEVQDGTWSIYAAETTLFPDVRFLVEEGQYAYLEFNSKEDPGVGVSTDFPFYREIQPNTYTAVRSQTLFWISEVFQLMNKDVKE